MKFIQYHNYTDSPQNFDLGAEKVDDEVGLEFESNESTRGALMIVYII